MDASGDGKQITTDEETNIYRLNMSVTVLRRLLSRQTENGAVSDDQTTMIEAAIAAGRNEARLVRAELEVMQISSPDLLQPVAQFLVRTVTELELLLDDMEGALGRLRG